MSATAHRPASKDTDSNDEDLEAAYRHAESTQLSRAAEIILPPAKIQELTAEEVAFGRVVLDQRGLTPGIRLHCFEPVAELLSQWRATRSRFDLRLVPHKEALDALDHVDAEVLKLEQDCDEEVAKRNQVLEANTKYKELAARYEHAQARLTQKKQENNGRVPTMWGSTWSYMIAIGCIGIAEWMINYDTFYSFLQVPAIAAGATIILGVLLAFSAHAHGMLIKQWPHRFGLHCTPHERFSNYRWLGLATFGLLIVLVAAGGSRYAAAVRTMVAHSGPNLLGAEAQIDVDPLRDVLLSLLANVAAWAVGVFIAHLAHDQDQEFMESAVEVRRLSNPYHRMRGRTDRDIESIKARYAKRLQEKRTAAASKSFDVQAERSLLLRVREHEKVLITACTRALRTSAEAYRDMLIKQAAHRQGGFVIVTVDGNVLSIYEWKNAPLLIEEELVRGL